MEKIASNERTYEKSNHNRRTHIFPWRCDYFVLCFFCLFLLLQMHHVFSSSYFTRDTFYHIPAKFKRNHEWKEKKEKTGCKNVREECRKICKNEFGERKKSWNDSNDEVMDGMKQSGKHVLFSYHLYGCGNVMSILFRQWYVCFGFIVFRSDVQCLRP